MYIYVINQSDFEKFHLRWIHESQETSGERPRTLIPGVSREFPAVTTLETAAKRHAPDYGISLAVEPPQSVLSLANDPPGADVRSQRLLRSSVRPTWPNLNGAGGSA